MLLFYGILYVIDMRKVSNTDPHISPHIHSLLFLSFMLTLKHFSFTSLILFSLFLLGASLINELANGIIELSFTFLILISFTNVFYFEAQLLQRLRLVIISWCRPSFTDTLNLLFHRFNHLSFHFTKLISFLSFSIFITFFTEEFSFFFIFYTTIYKKKLFGRWQEVR